MMPRGCRQASWSCSDKSPLAPNHLSQPLLKALASRKLLRYHVISPVGAPERLAGSKRGETVPSPSLSVKTPPDSNRKERAMLATRIRQKEGTFYFVAYKAAALWKGSVSEPLLF